MSVLDDAGGNFTFLGSISDPVAIEPFAHLPLVDSANRGLIHDKR